MGIALALVGVACGSDRPAEGELADDGKPHGERAGARCKNILSCPDGAGCHRGRCYRAGKVGEACDIDAQLFCTGHDPCVEGVCQKLAKLDAFCSEEWRCERGLDCFASKCRPEEEVVVSKKAAKERKMLEQSGVAPPPAEAIDALAPGPPAAAPGTAVRVVKVSATGDALAACKRNERLISGGCEGRSLSSNRPAAFSESDTVGARWICKSHSTNEITAFALCAALPSDKKERP